MPHSSSAPAWWQRGAVYQVYPRSFADGDGDGDLRGLASRLDHLSSRRVEAAWLSPIFVSPMADFGYDVANYCDVDPLFGTLADLDRPVEACHVRSIKVVLDWVPNHTSDRHPWFAASRSSRDDPRRRSSPTSNWDNPEVEDAMHDVLRFWLERGIDGFRLDAIAKIRQGPAAA